MKIYFGLKENSALRLDWLRFMALPLLLTGAMAAEASAAVKISARNPEICNVISKGLVPYKQLPMPYYVDSVEGEGSETIYKNVDIDKDGKLDELIRDCGSISEGSCSLYLKLSKGGRYEVLEAPFSVIHYKDKYFVLVGDTHPKANVGKRRLYELMEKKANLVCKEF